MKSKSYESRRKANKAPVKSRLRAISDELGVTTPKTVRRSSAGVKQAPRARPRRTR